MPWKPDTIEIITMRLGQNTNSKLLLRHDKYLRKLENRMLNCSYSHITCQLCPLFDDCLEWFDARIISGISKCKYIMSEDQYEKAIEEFKIVLEGKWLTIRKRFHPSILRQEQYVC